MPRDIIFESLRFRISGSESGQQLAEWLGQQLSSHGVETLRIRRSANNIGMEVSLSSAEYALQITPESTRDGHWRIHVVKQRKMSEKLFGKNPMQDTDPLLWMVESALQESSDFQNVRREQHKT